MRRFHRNLDITMIVVVALIFVIGLLFLYSASSSLSQTRSEQLIKKQVVSCLVGLLAGAFIISIDYRKFVDIAYVLYGLILIILVIVLVLGAIRLGAQRWITIGGFAFQPSEFTKIVFILALASFLGRRKDNIQNKRNIVIPMLLLGLPFLMIALQPDLGTALVLVPIFLAMVFIAGVNIKVIWGFMLTGFVSMPFLWHFLKGYQKKRIMVFLNPDLDPLGAGYTIIQSKVAIGSGQFWGRGWLSGTQSQLNFLPERHTDFIFSVVGEEWGFIGCVLIVTLYFIFIYKGIVTIRDTNDIYGKLIATGITTLFCFQIFVNIGMTLGLLPVVGLTLPFISYGGSSLISSIMAVCLLLNISYRKPYF